MVIKRITRYRTETFRSKGEQPATTCRKSRGCKNRGEFVGKADCGCSGAPKIYRCNAISDTFCTSSDINKSHFPIISDTGKTLYESIATSEVVRCGPQTCTKFMEDTDGTTTITAGD